MIINHQKEYWACFGLVFEAAVAYLSHESWQQWLAINIVMLINITNVVTLYNKVH